MRKIALKNNYGYWMTGKKLSKETRAKMKGKKPWNKDLSKETDKRLRAASKKQSDSAKRHPSNTLNKTWKQKEHGEYYGLTYTQKREKQAGRKKPKKCDICKQTGKINFDHCHKSGKFRGWICWNCNTAIGHAKDNPAILKRMIKYLNKHV